MDISLFYTNLVEDRCSRVKTHTNSYSMVNECCSIGQDWKYVTGSIAR